MSKTNLLPTGYIKRHAANHARRLWLRAALLSLVACVVAVTLAVIRPKPVEDASLSERVAIAESRVGLSMAKTATLNEQLTANRQAAAAIDAVAGQPDWQALLERLGSELGEEAVLTRLSFAPDPRRGGAWLLMEGVAGAYPDVPALVLRLEALGLFEQVELVATRSEPFAGETRVGFQIACEAKQ